MVVLNIAKLRHGVEAKQLSEVAEGLDVDDSGAGELPGQWVVGETRRAQPRRRSGWGVAARVMGGGAPGGGIDPERHRSIRKWGHAPLDGSVDGLVDGGGQNEVWDELRSTHERRQSRLGT